MEVSITLPTELKDIKIWQVHEYEQLNKDRDDLEVLINMVSIFCELPTSDTRLMPYKTLVYCGQKITEALSQEPKLVRTFEWEGVQYGFVPNLDDITVGEFIDLENYQQDKKDLWKLLSVLYRPIVYKQDEKYRVADYDGTLVASFKNLNAEVGYGALLFFCSLGTDLLNYTLKYLLPKEVVESTTLNKPPSPESGDGLHSFTRLVKEMYLELKELQAKEFILHYNGLPTRWTYKKWKRN
jgi:hypothetical protein